jgi:hypothetical protein
VRLTAVGNITRRLVTNCLFHVTNEKAWALLAPFQSGVSVHAEAESFIHDPVAWWPSATQTHTMSCCNWKFKMPLIYQA